MAHHHGLSRLLVVFAPVLAVLEAHLVVDDPREGLHDVVPCGVPLRRLHSSTLECSDRHHPCVVSGLCAKWEALEADQAHGAGRLVTRELHHEVSGGIFAVWNLVDLFRVDLHALALLVSCTLLDVDLEHALWRHAEGCNTL
eukprot:scaffold100878_cov81-Phaeocystis_antarctica.AAC.7